MTDNTPSRDINEIFERILLAEDCAGQAGYLEGIEAGRKKTFEAYHVGFHRGSALSMKLGYYYGVAESCIISNKFPPKVVELAEKVQSDVRNFPKTNDKSVDILNLAESIKCKFLKLCALAKIDSTYPGAETLDF